MAHPKIAACNCCSHVRKRIAPAAELVRHILPPLELTLDRDTNKLVVAPVHGGENDKTRAMR
jgi:hypothetical protein